MTCHSSPNSRHKPASVCLVPLIFLFLLFWWVMSCRESDEIEDTRRHRNGSGGDDGKREDIWERCETKGDGKKEEKRNDETPAGFCQSFLLFSYVILLIHGYPDHLGYLNFFHRFFRLLFLILFGRIFKVTSPCRLGLSSNKWLLLLSIPRHYIRPTT